MSKEFKNSGITKACPYCRKIIIKEGKFNGQGIFKMKCPNCQKVLSVNVDLQMIIKASVLILVGILSYLLGAYVHRVVAHYNTVSCQSLLSKGINPQAYYDTRQKNYTKLYVNKDGKVCTNE